MTAPERLSLRLRAWMERNAPFAVLWRAEARDHAETKRALKAAEDEVRALRAHHALAVDQRTRARDFAAACGIEHGEGWDATDDAILGAWLDGERPA